MIDRPNCFTFAVAVSAIAYAAPMRAATTQPVDLSCAPLPDRNPTPRDPIVSIRVTENDGLWKVVLASANGNKYYRAKQYNIRDISAPDVPSWSGTLLTNSAIKMVGAVYWEDGAFRYVESLFDANQGGDRIAQYSAFCAIWQATRPAAMIAAPVAAPPIQQRSPHPQLLLPLHRPPNQTFEHRMTCPSPLSISGIV